MARTVIDQMYSEFNDLISFLESAGEVSLRISADNVFKKTLALSAASYYEDEIRRILLKITGIRASSDILVSSFVKNKAISRQYHTYFKWDSNNANSFFGLFGDEFLESAKSDVKNNQDLADSIKSFLNLGNLRNELAHLNFASFILDKTAEEVYKQYISANRFILYLESKLETFSLATS